MKIEILAVGKLKEQYWRQAQMEYVKRLRGYADISVREVASRDPAKYGGDMQALEREATDLLAAMQPGSHIVLLAPEGMAWTSPGFSAHLDELKLRGVSNFTFVVGSSCGVSPSVHMRADEQWSFGPITLPHELARIVALEQIYRAFRISRGEPYHK